MTANKNNGAVEPEHRSARSEAAMNTKVLERYLEHMEQSSKRWEKMVFPAMVAFIVLAGYGFFLVNSLSTDMRLIANTITHDFRREMVSISEDMHHMTQEITQMRAVVTTMSDKMDPLQDMTPMLAEMRKLDESVASINESVRHVDTSIDNMDGSINNMNRSVRSMGHDMDDISDSFSAPLGPFKKFMPW